RMLRKEKAELTITLQDNPRLALLAALSGASKRVGFARHWSRKLFYTHPVLPRDKQHRIDYYLDITDQLPEVNNIINEGLEIYIPQNIKNWAEEFLKENDLGKNKIIGFVVGAGWASKEWPESYFLRLGKLILKQDIPLIIFGGKKERKKAERLSGQMGKQVINVAGKTDIMQLAALMSWCELVVAGDTGPMHVAVAAGTRVVSLFGPTEPWRYRPYGNKHEVIYLNQECQPCHEKECKKEKNCLKELSVNRVFERIQRYI
ncbi:MAG: glycosyltransferase family 9 protein, partial [Halanaerobiales bacterium]